MSTTSRTMLTALLCAAAVGAQFVGGKATRDALFLTSLGFHALPAMLIATSACSLLLVAAQMRWAARVSPATLAQALFAASGVLFVCEWAARFTAPAATAVVLYLHVSGAGPLLASGVWLMTSERFDPHTAKQRFGQIAGAGTLGGLLGALVAERVAAELGAPAMLLFLAGSQFLTAWLVSRLVRPSDAPTQGQPSSVVQAPARSALSVVAGAPHLRHLVALVMFGATSAALLDYLFKAKAVEAFGAGDQLLRFFALYYAATSLITFILQVISSHAVLERFGLALTTSTPSIALLAGSIGGLVAPGFGSILTARATESIFRGSWFRAGYELFYTPLPAAEKRSVKSFVDVGVDRMGDAFGAGLVRLATVLAPAASASAILWMGALSAAAAIFAASRLNRWYVRTLGTSLIAQAAELPRAEPEDYATRHILVGVRGPEPGVRGARRRGAVDPEIQDALALRSGDPARAIEVLSRETGLAAGLVPHAIPLLARDALADHALTALRKVAEQRIGQLTDALLDRDQDFAVRRRLARVFSGSTSQRAADGLMLALDDPRFDVRFQSARSLAAILGRNPGVRIDRDRVYEVVLKEVAVGRPVWESRRLLDGFVSASPLDEFVRDRAGQSLAHVFTLLSLVLPSQPLQIAFRSLHSKDARLRGTALEYLDGVLPAPIRQRLWPFLVEGRFKRPSQPHDQVIADLLKASPSITLHGVAGRA